MTMSVGFLQLHDIASSFKSIFSIICTHLADTWRSLAFLPVARGDAAMTAVPSQFGNRLIVLGGESQANLIYHLLCRARTKRKCMFGVANACMVILTSYLIIRK